MNHQTKQYRKLYDPERDREHGPDGTLETYYAANVLVGAEDSEISLTVNEREDFERDTGIELEADVLPDETFTALLDWARQEGLLV